MKNYNVLESQNIIDTSIMLYGNVENAFKLAIDNNITLNNGIQYNDVLIYDETNTDSFIIKKTIKEKGLVFTTGALSGEAEFVDNPDFTDIFDNSFDDTFE